MQHLHAWHISYGTEVRELSVIDFLLIHASPRLVAVGLLRELFTAQAAMKFGQPTQRRQQADDDDDTHCHG